MSPLAGLDGALLRSVKFNGGVVDESDTLTVPSDKVNDPVISCSFSAPLPPISAEKTGVMRYASIIQTTQNAKHPAANCLTVESLRIIPL
jgi:hypothetical protein